MIIQGQLLSASNLNSAYISKTSTGTQSINSTLTISGGALTLKNSIITDNANSSYMQIDPQGNKVIIYDGVNNQRLDVYSSSGSESTYIQTINGTKSFGQIDVSSAIDHLELNTNSKKQTIVGGDIILSGNGRQLRLKGSTVNQDNIASIVFDEGDGGDHFRLQFDGSGGAGSGRLVLTPLGQTGITYDRIGNLGIANSSPSYRLDVSGDIHATGLVRIDSNNPFYFNSYGGGIFMQDTTWIRTYGGKSFYHDTGNFRTDGTLQVGNGGATLSVPNNGTLNYMNGKFTVATDGTTNIAGATTISGTTTIANGAVLTKVGSQGSGLKIGSVNIDSVTGRDIALQNIDSIRFGSGTAWDYNQWAGIKYDNTNLKLYIGGPASAQFSSNSSPATIDMAFTGVGHVGVANDSPVKTLDVGGDIRLTNNFYSPTAVNLYTDTGTSQSMRVGGLVVGSDYTKNAPTNGLYVQGNIGINNPTPAYNLDISGNMNVTGIIYSLGNNQANFQVGDDAQLWDINVSNTVGIYGVQNPAVGALKLGSTGPTLYGSGNFLGIGTTNPAYMLDINGGNIRISAGHNIVSSYNNAYFLADHNNGDISLSAVGRNLVLGLQNTSQVAINSPLYGSNNTTQILGTDGTLYYKGQDADTRYVNVTGDTMTGALTITASGDGTVLQTYNTERAWSVIQSSTGASSALAFKSSTAGKSFQVQNVSGNVVLDVLTNTSSTDGTVTVNGTLSMSNNAINSVGSISGQYGTIARSVDEWLRLNDDGTHTSGVYLGSSVVRTDGQFQIGSSGSKLLIDANGNITTAGTISVPVGSTSKIATAGFGHGNEMWGTSGSGGTGSLYINYRSYDETTNNVMNTYIANGKGTTLLSINGATSAVSTKNSTLDDGSGNMTISGKFTAGGIGFGNVTSGYYGDSSNLAPRIPSSSGYFAVQNSSLVTQFQVNGTGRVSTAKNVLDDASGNATFVGTVTLGADPSTTMQSTTKQYVDRKASFIPINTIYAKNAIDNYPISMLSVMKFNSGLAGVDWGSGSDGMQAGLVITKSSRDTSTDNSAGGLYPGSVHQTLHHESGYGMFHRYGLASKAYTNITVWSPSKSVTTLNSLYMPTSLNENGYYYKLTTTGNTGATEPLWNTTGTTTDGTAVWTVAGSFWSAWDKVLTGQTMNSTDVANAVGQGLTTTSNPTFSALNVNGNITGSATFISNSTSSDIFQALGSSGTKTFRWEGGNLRFWSAQSGVGEALTLASNGFIGIHNTSSPSYQLDVSGDIRTTTAFRATANNTQALYVGSNSAIWDVNTSNTIGIYGQQNTAVGGLKLGSTGPTLYGTGNMLGIGTTSPAYTLDVYGNIAIGSGNAIYDRYNSQPILKDYGNGNIVINGAGGYLYIGYQNTTKNILQSSLYGSTTSMQILGTDGTLYYQGSDTNSVYVRQDGTSSMSGDLNLNSHRLVFTNGGTTNLDHIWFDDNSSPYGDGGSYHFVADTSGNAIGNATLRAGSLAVSNQIDMQNHNIYNISTLSGQYGTIAKSVDEWLRINDDNSHSNGVYFGSSTVRTDGTLQVGNLGSTLNIPQNGTFNWQNGNLTISSGGALTAKGQIVSNTTYGQGQGFKLDTVTIDTVISTGNVAIGGLNQLRFGTSTAWDYNQWAGIKYDSNSHYLYIGGPASSQFTANGSTPPTINVAFTGVGNVGVGTDTPLRTLDVGGDARVSGNIYGGTGTLNLLTDAGGALPIKAGSLAITSSYSNNAPTNGLYVQGAVGIGTTTVNSKFQVNETNWNLYTGTDYMYMKYTHDGTHYPYIGWLDSGGTRGGFLGWGVPGSYLQLQLENNNNLYIGGGNVGIGTTTPSYLLDVNGSGKVSNLTVNNSSGDSITLNGSNTLRTIRFDNSNLRFWNPTAYEMMTLTSGGNVGINQANPAYKLDVNGDINVTGVVYSPATNAKAYQVGGNSELWDINVINTMGLYGHSNTAVGGLKLGSTGPTLYGSGGTLGIGTTSPWTSMALDVAGSIRISAGHGIYSGYNNSYIVNDHNNGNVTLNATSSASGNLYLGYNNTAHVYLSTNLTTTSNTNIIGTDGTLYYKGQDTDIRYVNSTGDTISGNITFGGNANYGIYSDPSNWTRIDPNGQRFIMPVPQSRVNTGDLILSVEDTTNWTHHFELNANGNMKVNNLTATGNVTLNNTSISGVTTITGQYGRIANSRSDEWLGLNDDNSHTSGVYFGSSITRTDGTLQVGSNGAYFNANSSGITLNAIPIVNRSGDGTELLRFNTERAWSFYQVGASANANLALKSSTAGKEFQIQNVSGNTVLDVSTGTTSTDGLVTVNGDSQVNSGKQGMTGYVKVIQAVPDLSTHTSITTSGWYNIAHNPNGDRAFGKFTLLDTSIARHQVVQFTAANAFSSGIVATVHLIGQVRAAAPPFTAIRHVYNGSSSGDYWLQVWIDISDNTSNPASVRCILEDNYWESGWQLLNFTTGTVPSGYTTNTFQISDHDHMPNLYTSSGSPPSQGGGIGDVFIQF